MNFSRYDISDYLAALMAVGVQGFLLMNVPLHLYFSIQGIFISIMMFFIKRDEDDVPLWTLCNGIILPILILYLEYKLIMNIVKFIQNGLYEQRRFREDYYDLDYSYNRRKSQVIEVKEEPKQLGYSFKEYLTNNDKEYQALKNAHDALLEENITLKSQNKKSDNYYGTDYRESY